MTKLKVAFAILQTHLKRQTWEEFKKINKQTLKETSSNAETMTKLQRMQPKCQKLHQTLKEIIQIWEMSQNVIWNIFLPSLFLQGIMFKNLSGTVSRNTGKKAGRNKFYITHIKVQWSIKKHKERMQTATANYTNFKFTYYKKNS